MNLELQLTVVEHRKDELFIERLMMSARKEGIATASRKEEE